MPENVTQYRPWVGRKFGVELEMNRRTTDNVTLGTEHLRAAVREGLRLAEVPATRLSSRDPGYFNSNGQTWDIKTDASAGWEVASPAMVLDADAECRELREVTNRLAALNPRIDRTCGLHVHVEVLDYDWRDLRNLIVLWARYEPFVFELCPPSRRRNGYCEAIRKSEWSAGDAGHWTRFEQILMTNTEQSVRGMPQPRGAVNLAHFWHSHRVEFRLGAGTVNYEKIVRWVQFILSFVGRVKQTDMPMIQTGQFSNRGFSTAYVGKMLGLIPSRYVPSEKIPDASTKLVEWVERRRAQFQRPGSTDEQTGGTDRGR
jgi:hypothetical protein